MGSMLDVFLFVFGAIIGSFLNVTALRWNSGLGLGGRSFCPTCNKNLSWWELLPILSFIGLRGRCHKCKSKISWRYPIVEFVTGLVFLTVFKVLFSGDFNLLFLIIYTLFIFVGSIFIVITVYDLRHKIIPNNLVYVSIVLSLIIRVILGGGVLDYLAGPILFIFFGLIWLLSKGRAMGFGDAKLALAIGFLLGGAMGFSDIVLAFWLGALLGLILIGFSRLIPLLSGGKNITMKTEIPFAPFMLIGAWLSLVFQLDILNVLLF